MSELADARGHGRACPTRARPLAWTCGRARRAAWLLALCVLPLLIVCTLPRVTHASPPEPEGEPNKAATEATEATTTTTAASVRTHGCERLLAVDRLEPSERARIEAVLCPRDNQPAPDPASLQSPLRELITSGDWTAEIAVDVARTLALAPSQAELALARKALEAMLASPRCTLSAFLDEQIEQALAGEPVNSPRLGISEVPRACTASIDADALAALADVVLVGYYGHGGDVFEGVLADPTPAHVAPVVHDGEHGRAQLLLLPKRAAAVVFVREHDLALPWRRSLAFEHSSDFALTPRAQHECLKVEFTASSSEQPWHVIVDGVDFELMAEPEPGRSYAIARLDLVDIPPDAHTVEFVHDGQRKHHTVVQPTGTRRSCALVELDLRGLRPGYGLTRLVIDERCQQRGLVSAQVRTLVDRYFDSYDIDLVHLDVIVEIVSSFATIESSLAGDQEDGSSERELAAYSTELLRQGVAELLTLSVSCAEQGEDMIIVGQVIDLERFSQRERSRAAGRDISEILQSSTAIVEHRSGRRQGFEQVLGELLQFPTAQLQTLPANVDFQDALTIGYRVNRPDDAPAQFEFGMALIDNDNICAQADDLATLAAFDIAALRAEVEARAGGHLVKRELPELAPGQRSLTVARDVPLSGPGRYLVWVRDLDGEALSAACFRVSTHDVMLFGQFGGLSSSRPGAQWVQQLYYFRAAFGVLYPVGDRGFGRFGGQIGYSNTSYDSDAPPSWDDIANGSLGKYSPDGTTRLNWTRHGLTFAGLAGFEVPLGPCGYPFPDGDDDDAEARRARLARRCAKPFHRRWSFSGRVLLGGSFGFHDISGVPTEFNNLSVRKSSSNIVSDFDTELGVQMLFLVRWSPHVGVYVYHQLVVSDLESYISTETRTQPTVTNDFSIFNLVGVGIAWMRNAR